MTVFILTIIILGIAIAIYKRKNKNKCNIPDGIVKKIN